MLRNTVISTIVMALTACASTSDNSSEPSQIKQPQDIFVETTDFTETDIIKFNEIVESCQAMADEKVSSSSIGLGSGTSVGISAGRSSSGHSSRAVGININLSERRKARQEADRLANKQKQSVNAKCLRDNGYTILTTTPL